MRLLLPLLALAACASATLAVAAPPVFITLGTGSGPRPDAHRAQPANLLMTDGTRILIDVGDGASQQLGKAGVPLESVNNVLISHLHFDHTGGLFAYLSRRFQLRAPGIATIYGPPGTKATVDALIAAIAPGLESAQNISSRNPTGPTDTVRVVEIHDGWTGDIGGVRVTAASNTHYALAPNAATKADTYAYRFDVQGRSLVYTGDTGPSVAVERLARGADVLFAEVIDADATLASLKAARPDLAAPMAAIVEAHYRREHLSPLEVGLMSSRAGVHELVLTHDAIPDDGLVTARAAIAAHFKGQIVFANDLQRF